MHLNNRVLSRRGARELTLEETARVGGSLAFHTNVCTIPLPPITLTGTVDGDCGSGDLDNS